VVRDHRSELHRADRRFAQLVHLERDPDVSRALAACQAIELHLP
jgi:hypothetical protein